MEAIGWAITQRTSTSGARVALLVLAYRANEAGEAWPSLERLAADMAMTERGARRALAELEAAGLVRRERRHRRSNMFRLPMTGSRVPGTAVPGTGVPGTTTPSDRNRSSARTYKEPKEEIPLLRSAPAAAVAAESLEPLEARKALWTDGVAMLRRLTGMVEGPARSYIGKLLKATGDDDCAAVLDALRTCPTTGDPKAWLMGAAKARRAKPFRNGFFGLVAEEGIGSKPAEPNPVTAFLERAA